MKQYNITVNGNTYEVCVEEVGAENAAPAFVPAAAPVAKPAVKAAPKAAGAAGANKVTAPMPGTILDVKVKVGQTVKKGETVCVLEAMKMENEIPAPCDGVIASVNVAKGATVVANDVLASLN